MAAKKRKVKLNLKKPEPMDKPARLKRPFNGAVYKQPDRFSDVKTGYTLLIDAINKADIDRFNRLLASGASLEKCDKRGKTPLHHAACAGNIEMIEVLLKAGAAVNARDKNLATPLIDAVLSAPKPAGAVVKLLLSCSADANIPNALGCVPLHIAAYNNDSSIVPLLINATSRLSRPESTGKTALHIACAFNNIVMVGALLAARVDLLCANKDGDTPLHTALLQGSIASTQLLLETKGGGLLVNAVNLKNRSPLHIATQYGQAFIVNALIKRGANLNSVDSEGFSPLSIAAMHKPELVPLLVQHGADVAKIPPGSKTTPLSEALEAKNRKAALFLLDHGADPNTLVTERKNTPLMIGLNVKVDIDIVRKMLEAGGDVNKANIYGNTAMHVVCTSAMAEECRLFIASKKADLTAKDPDGRSLLYNAVQYNSGSVEVVRILLAAGLDPLAQDKSGDTPYDRANRIGNIMILDLFNKKLKEKGITYKPKNPPSPPWGWMR